MKTATVIYNADGSMTLVRGKISKQFDSLSRLVTYCQDHNIQAWAKPDQA